MSFLASAMRRRSIAFCGVSSVRLLRGCSRYVLLMLKPVGRVLLFALLLKLFGLLVRHAGARLARAQPRALLRESWAALIRRVLLFALRADANFALLSLVSNAVAHAVLQSLHAQPLYFISDGNMRHKNPACVPVTLPLSQSNFTDGSPPCL